MTQKIPDEDMLSSLAGFIKNLGYFPVRDEITMHSRTTPGFPHWTTVKKRYGGMPETASALLEFSHQTADTVLERLCQSRLELEAVKPMKVANGNRRQPTDIGFVYLKYSPSLRLYKIGKAVNPAKRGAGISLLLPEDLVPKHEIKTDYPYILEKYWEKRFRANKKQGEWYDLSSEDIRAFKTRREFMFSEFFP